MTKAQVWFIILLLNKCGHGGIGRRVRLRGVWETIRVQVPVPAPQKIGANFAPIFCDVGTHRVEPNEHSA